MRLIKLPEQPEQEFEEGYEMRGGLLSLLAGTSRFVKFKRAIPHQIIRHTHEIEVEMQRGDRMINQHLEKVFADLLCMEICERFRHHKIDLVIDGFIFCGVLPKSKLETADTWLLYIDLYEKLMSHKQQYRYKHFPAGLKRIEFTTTADFLDRITFPDVKHVVVDSATAQLLSDDFESFQQNAIVPPHQYQKVGLILEVHGRLIFSDMGLDRNMQWVNENPGSDSARPQFIIVQPDQLQLFSYDIK